MKSGDQPQKKFPLIRRSSVSPDPALSAMGLLAMSQTSGVPADSLLAVVATLFAGLAGPDASIRDSLGPCRLAKLDLLTSAEDFRLQRSINRFTCPLETIQRRLGENMGRYSPDALELTANGAFSNSTTIKLADQDLREKSLRRHIDTLTVTSEPGSSSALLQDLADDPVPARKEAILHPQFLVKGADGPSLLALVGNCHQRTALVVHPKLDLARKGPEASKVMKILTNLLDGMTVTKRPDSIERGRDASLLAKAHALLALTKPEVEAMHGLDPTHLNRFLWLKAGDGQDIKPDDVNACETFRNAYHGAVEEILGLRREGRGLMMDFESPKMAAKFESELHTYEDEIQQTAANAGPWARGLPQTLFWALGFLRRSMPAKCRPDDESLMTSSFAVARRQVENHCHQVQVITRAKVLADRHRLARKMIAMVSNAAAPVKFRDLARCSYVQRKENIAPLVDALIDVGVLVRDEDGIHTLGPVDLAEARELLDRQFAQS